LAAEACPRFTKVFLWEHVFQRGTALRMTIQGKQFKVTAPWCSKGCGRKRRAGGRYCLECHRLDQRRRETAKMTDAAILARAVKKLEKMLRGYE
jgi:hypothetical protein